MFQTVLQCIEIPKPWIILYYLSLILEAKLTDFSILGQNTRIKRTITKINSLIVGNYLAPILFILVFTPGNDEQDNCKENLENQIYRETKAKN